MIPFPGCLLETPRNTPIRLFLLQLDEMASITLFYPPFYP
jgi:hypothetical protein